LVAGPADAKKRSKNSGVNVKVKVLDESNEAVATAVIRHPEEDQRHPVNSVDGTWEAAVLYLPDGSELMFVPGERLRLEISAPGFVTQHVEYQIKRRRNSFAVNLKAIELDDEEIEAPVIQFGRDRPREGGGGVPSN
jgi:hypothetical protein